MKAWVLHGIGDIRFEEVEEPDLKEREVLIQVRAAGICGSDIPRIYSAGTYSYPLIPGHEFSGVVEKTGTGVDGKWLNKRVGIYPLIPCRDCIPCREKQYEMCRHYSYLGSRRDGGFGEYVAVPADNLIELPDNVSFQEGAMLEPMAVAVHAIRKAAPKAVDKVVICGLGTIGMLVLMFLQEAGIRDILAIGNKEFQKQMVLKLGLSGESYFDGRDPEVEKRLAERTGGSGSDVFFECVGKNETLAQGVKLAAPGGRVCLVGNPYSGMVLDKNIYWKILRNQLTVMGTWNSSFTQDEGDDWHYVLQRLGQKQVKPAELISHVFPRRELIQGTRIMRDKTEDYIKIMAV